jgi:hypothetical protein
MLNFFPVSRDVVSQEAILLYLENTFTDADWLQEQFPGTDIVISRQRSGRT